MSSGYRFRLLDVFSARPYAGSALAVLPEAQGLSAEQMQGIAREFGLTATAFVRPARSSGHTHRLRVFTAAKELPFAGHATIGAALTLAMEGDERAEFVFEEDAGPVQVSMRPGPGAGTAWMWAPRLPEVGPDPPPPVALAALLSLKVTDLLAGAWRPAAVSAGLPFLVVPVRDLDALRRVRLDMARWREMLQNWWAAQVYVVTPMEAGRDLYFRARTFAPGIGIDEDPAGGAAASALPAWLVPRLKPADGPLSFVIEQGIEMGRPSTLAVEVDVKGGAIASVRVGGAAVTVAEGRIQPPPREPRQTDREGGRRP